MAVILKIDCNGRFDRYFQNIGHNSKKKKKKRQKNPFFLAKRSKEDGEDQGADDRFIKCYYKMEEKQEEKTRSCMCRGET